MPGQKHQPENYKKKTSKKADSRLMQEQGEKRSGSDSDAHDRAGENHGENQTLMPGALAADDIKSMHTILADLPVLDSNRARSI